MQIIYHLEGCLDVFFHSSANTHHSHLLNIFGNSSLQTFPNWRGRILRFSVHPAPHEGPEQGVTPSRSLRSYSWVPVPYSHATAIFTALFGFGAHILISLEFIIKTHWETDTRCKRQKY